MRRHGLRERIRHQRRLTRRLALRHVLIRRPNSVARTLEALGAWMVEPLAQPSRFVPALIEPEAEVTAAPAYLPMPAAPDVPQVADELWEDALTSSATPDAGLAVPNVMTTPWPAPEPA